MMLEDIDPGIIRVRAHHLLCLQGFQGYGYDQEFILKMEEIVQISKSEPSPLIQIVTIADDLCSTCPNLIEKKCVDHQKIKGMDSYIIEHTSLEENQLISFNKALETISHELSSDDIKNVCDNCTWVDKCLFYMNKI